VPQSLSADRVTHEPFQHKSWVFLKTFNIVNSFLDSIYFLKELVAESLRLVQNE
jgi:hypothetical protein